MLEYAVTQHCLDRHTNSIKINLKATLDKTQETEQKERAVKRTIILLQFLKDNQLINFDPFDKNNRLKEHIIVIESNLINNGLQLFKSAVPKCYSHIYRGGDINNTEILSKQLKKINGER